MIKASYITALLLALAFSATPCHAAAKERQHAIVLSYDTSSIQASGDTTLLITADQLKHLTQMADGLCDSLAQRVLFLEQKTDSLQESLSSANRKQKAMAYIIFILVIASCLLVVTLILWKKRRKAFIINTITGDRRMQQWRDQKTTNQPQQQPSVNIKPLEQDILELRRRITSLEDASKKKPEAKAAASSEERPTKLYANSIIKDEGRYFFYNVTAKPDANNTIYELSLTDNDRGTFTIWEGCHKKILSNAAFLEGCEKNVLPGATEVRIVKKGTAQRQAGSQWIVLEKLHVELK